MCGIVGYTGRKEALPILLKGLHSLEYRGYDSSGVAIGNGDGFQVVKTAGRISALEKKLADEAPLSGTFGIGHTRWATHGAPTEENAHPHVGGNGRIALVHNGIIENDSDLRVSLEKLGIQFVSQTDTEVLAQLFDHFYNGDLVAAMCEVMKVVRGSFALAVIARDQPGTILAVRKDSPLVIAVGQGENYLASDIPALLPFSRECCILKDGELALLSADKVRVFDAQNNELSLSLTHIPWDVEAAEKGGYRHFMRKEIAEQPKAVRDTISPRLKGESVFLGEKMPDDKQIRACSRIHIAACGSAWHVGTAAKYIIEKMAKIPTEVDLASEFRYRGPLFSKNDLCIIISQSGETADSLAALREAKRNGVRVLSIINVAGSTIARESDYVLETYAGPEIAVATTKAFSAQLAAVYLLALRFARAKQVLSAEEEADYVRALEDLPGKIEATLALQDQIHGLAEKYKNAEEYFFIGRGLDYALSLEGALKLKEISYLHAESYAAGELKHGTISLIEPGVPVFAVALQDDLFQKTLSNICEVKARGAAVLALVAADHAEKAADFADDILTVPRTESLFMPSLGVLPLQLFAYETALLRGCDIDKPRNLAKSVTVE